MATTSQLTIWDDEPAPGVLNMAADELLAEETARTGGVAMRLYRWSRPTLSLGGFQKSSDAASLVQAAGLDLVRRPSGGGAILHGTDLTYAVAVSRGHPLAGAPQSLYDALHQAMVETLREAGFAASLFSAGNAPAGGSGESSPDGPLLCFDRRAVGDVLVGPHKVLGSAQRRLAGSILQHGSFLLTQCDQAGPACTRPGLLELAAGDDAREAKVRACAELLEDSPCEGVASAVELIDRWIERLATAEGFAVVRAGAFVRGPMRHRVEERAERFQASTWLHRR